MADIDPLAALLAEQICAEIELAPGRFGRLRSWEADVAAYQLLWARYVSTGARRLGAAVLASLRAVCRDADECRRGRSSVGPLGDDARLLELLTWVWRVERCADIRRHAEEIVVRAIAEQRVPGAGFAASAAGASSDHGFRFEANGLMLVALVEAGSVFERRDWLALAREIFEELIARRAERACDPVAHLDEHAVTARAAVRLFEAFGKQRYLDLAEALMAKNDADGDISSADAPSLGTALMVGVLARLHALTGASSYAERVDALVAALRPAIVRSGIAAATAVANALTAARLLSIRVTGDPRLVETREIMRIALDCGLPDRLVLGPGAGGAPGERPLAQIHVGALRLAPVEDAARLRVLLAPGGLAAAFDATACAKLLTASEGTA